VGRHYARGGGGHGSRSSDRFCSGLKGCDVRCPQKALPRRTCGSKRVVLHKGARTRYASRCDTGPGAQQVIRCQKLGRRSQTAAPQTDRHNFLGYPPQLLPSSREVLWHAANKVPQVPAAHVRIFSRRRQRERSVLIVRSTAFLPGNRLQSSRFYLREAWAFVGRRHCLRRAGQSMLVCTTTDIGSQTSP